MKNITNSLILIITLLGSFNANALLIKLDFVTNPSVDYWGDVTTGFDVSQAGFAPTAFTTITENILKYIREDFYSNAYGFIPNNQQLDIDFIIAQHGTDVSGIDANNQTIQIGSTSTSSYFGQACLSCVSNASVPSNTIFGSIFSNNIYNGLLAAAGGSWDLIEATNAIAGTLSHEIGHSLGISHPSGPEANPGESPWGLVATGASPSNMPNSERLKNRAFSYATMELLVQNIGLRTIALPVPEPSSFFLMLAGCFLMLNRLIKNSLINR